MSSRAYATLAQYFEKSGDTQQAFADALGVSQSYISRIAKGIAEPSLGLAVKIADRANIPVETLLSGANQAQPLAGDASA